MNDDAEVNEQNNLEGDEGSPERASSVENPSDADVSVAEQDTASDDTPGDTIEPPEKKVAEDADSSVSEEMLAKLAAAKAAVAEAEANALPTEESEAKEEARAETKPQADKNASQPPEKPLKKNKKKPMLPPQLAAGGAGWLATFADLMSLLMAFFVMLFAMSEVDKAKFEMMGESMTKALGSSAQIEKMMKKKAQEKELEELKKEMEKHKEQFKEQQEKLKKHEGQEETTKKDAKKLQEVLAKQVSAKEVEIEQKGKVIVIRMLQSGAFDSGSAKLKKDFIPVIRKLEKTINNMEGDIIVSGHTDNVVVESDIYRSNWELSAARAFSVIQALTQDKKLTENRLVLRGFGMTRPRVPNNSPENRAKNRRVEIMIDQRPAPVKQKAKEGSDTPKNLATKKNASESAPAEPIVAANETAAQALETIR